MKEIWRDEFCRFCILMMLGYTVFFIIICIWGKSTVPS